MRHLLLIVVVVLGTLLSRNSKGQVPEAAMSSLEPELFLCSALEKVEPGRRLPVLVSGVVVLGMEHLAFFDPEEPLCTWDVQPSTWLDFAPELASNQLLGRLDKLLEKSHRAYATIRGELHGPLPLGPDDPSLSPPVAFANRVGIRRYGHLGAFRTKLVVTEVVEVAPVATDLSTAPILYAPDPPSEDIEVLRADLVHYPERARKAGISGVVTMRVAVTSGEVVSAERLSGDRMLEAATAANIKSWRFSKHVDTTFDTTFIYRLERKLTGLSSEEYVELRLPWLTRVTAPRYDW